MDAVLLEFFGTSHILVNKPCNYNINYTNEICLDSGAWKSIND